MNLNNIEFNIVSKQFEAAEEVLVSISDLALDPKFQMRETMDLEHVEAMSEAVDDVPAIHVAETNGEFYVLDGFHRTHAALHAGREDIRAKVVELGRATALNYAMAANFAHFEAGLQPSKGAKKRAIEMFCANNREAFGLNNSKVVALLEDWGMTRGSSARWVRACTEKMRNEIKEARDAEIERMAGEGMTQRDIAKAVGCDHKTVGNTLKELKEIAGEKRTSSEIPQDDNSTPSTFDSSAPWSDTASDVEDSPFFDEEELDDTPAVNPADAFNKALEQHEEERSAQVASDVHTNDDVNEKFSGNQVSAALNLLAAALGTPTAKEQIEELLASDSDVDAQNIAACLPFFKQLIEDRS